MAYLRAVVLLLMGFSTGAMVVAEPKDFSLSDDVAGPTCLNYLGMGSYAWTKKGGDWIDKAGTLHGNQPFDATTVLVGKGRPFVEWDVTEIVKGWTEARFPNAGILLRVQKGEASGVIDFHSRESDDRSARPMLKLQWANGTQTRLSPVADTFLDCTSLSSLGAWKQLKVSGSQSGYIRFVVPASSAGLRQATLYMTSDVQYGSSAKIGVYRASPPFSRASRKPVMGLSEDFRNDTDINRHPDVVFATNFNSIAWRFEWSEMSFRSNAETISEDAPNRFEPLDGNALRVRLVKGKNFGLDLRYNFAKKGIAEPDEIYFRYYLRFGDDWNPYTDGGKLPGIAGTYGRAGWGMRKTDGYNGWSLRGGFMARPPAAKSLVGLTSLVSYAYHTDIQDASGDLWDWGEGATGLLENNRWYSVEQYVKLNTPGTSNGVVRAWVDGVQVKEKTDINFRKTPDLKIETIWMDVYHGGAGVSPENMSLYIDNVVVARRYIGPMKR